MAPSTTFLLFISLIGTLISQSQSLTCTSQSFPNRSFAHCDDLPHLNAFLHWTHDPRNNSLSVAFLAPPPHSSGWVAWAVNPSATGMAGAQAFVAFLSATSAAAVRTFNISSYSAVDPSPLSFPVWNLAAESSAGRFAIFASIKLPPNAKSLNQVWQVGPAADPESGAPSVHEFKPANLNAKSVLVFDKKSGSAVGGSGPAPAPRARGGESASTAPVVGGNETATATAAAAPDKGGVAGIRNGRLGSVVGLFGLVLGVICF